MKKCILGVLSMVCVLSLQAQGKFAGSFRPLIEKVYRDEKELPELRNFISRGGSLLSDPNESEKFAVSWFSKDATIIAFFEIVKEDNSRQILDVLEIKQVGVGQELKIGDCKDGEDESVSFVALVLPAKTQRLTAIKAWFFNRDKIRIEAWPAANVTCLGMEGDD